MEVHGLWNPTNAKFELIHSNTTKGHGEDEKVLWGYECSVSAIKLNSPINPIVMIAGKIKTRFGNECWKGLDLPVKSTIFHFVSVSTTSGCYKLQYWTAPSFRNQSISLKLPFQSSSKINFLRTSRSWGEQSETKDLNHEKSLNFVIRTETWS